MVPILLRTGHLREPKTPPLHIFALNVLQYRPLDSAGHLMLWTTRPFLLRRDTKGRRFVLALPELGLGLPGIFHLVPQNFHSGS